MKDPAYRLEVTPDGRTIDVSGPWSEGVADAVRRDADVLVLNYAHGFCEKDLEFLAEDFGVRKLKVLDRKLSDLTPVARLGLSLEELSVEVAPRAVLELAELPHLHILAGEWPLIHDSLDSVTELTSLTTWRFGEPDMHAFQEHLTLRRITIKEARYLESLSGIGELPDLEALHLIGAPRLSDLDDVRGVASSLERLELQGCRSLTAVDDIADLVNLRWLGVKDCGEIESLAPIRSLSQLEVFHAWESTRIVDGDLSPLAKLPRLREIRMRDRRSYKPRLTELLPIPD